MIGVLMLAFPKENLLLTNTRLDSVWRERDTRKNQYFNSARHFLIFIETWLGLNNIYWKQRHM